MLIWLFGDVKYSEMHLSDPKKMGGYIELAKAKVRWFLSVDRKDLPPEAVKAGRPTFRSITMDNPMKNPVKSGARNIHPFVLKQNMV